VLGLFYNTVAPSPVGGARKGKEAVQWEELAQRFVDAGWELDTSFEGYLIIGHNDHRISLVAHKEWWDPDDPTFELLDHEQMNTYWVREVPAPRHAALLLEEHGQPPEEGDLLP
jgi:hypothetical protein